MRAIFHIILHAVVPAFIARRFFKETPWAAFAIMMLSMAVDLDHFFAEPIYDPNRCSIGFHPLHAWWLQPMYLVLCFFPKTRLLGLGLVVHMILDALDCGWMIWGWP
jgi:hypothetical protein